MATTINACFDEIEQLQNSTYRVIQSILEAKYAKDSDELPEVARSARVKEANELIKRIPDLLCVIDVALKNGNQSEEDKNYTREKYDLFSIKVSTLKEKLKLAQLEAYKKENESVHEQILAKYNCIPAQNEADTEKKPISTDLFAGRSTMSKSKDGKSVEDQITTHNKNITSSLKQTRQLITMSVMQTELNIDTLDQQYKDLLKFNSKMMDMESILLKSRQIVKFIERQDKQDKRRIYMAVGFLLLCSAWVLWHRVLRTPVRILMWTVLKTLGIINWISAKSSTEKIDYGMTASNGLDEFVSTSIASTKVMTSAATDVSLIDKKPTQTLSYITWEPSKEENSYTTFNESMYLEYTPSSILSQTTEVLKPQHVSDVQKTATASSETLQLEDKLTAEIVPELTLEAKLTVEPIVESIVEPEVEPEVEPPVEPVVEPEVGEAESKAEPEVNSEIESENEPEMTSEELFKVAPDTKTEIVSEVIEVIPIEVISEKSSNKIKESISQDILAENKDPQREMTETAKLDSIESEAESVPDETQNVNEIIIEEDSQDTKNDEFGSPNKKARSEGNELPRESSKVDLSGQIESHFSKVASEASDSNIHDEL